jgi:hypothetical protein
MLPWLETPEVHRVTPLPFRAASPLPRAPTRQHRSSGWGASVLTA